ncbi:diguanylate cyclase [Musicola paradisiaca]|uniref:diguanylate cyclase n=1 Tax=Musicola paradisiaca (strain Ech703) TaxID=579405 RepID=C6C817_MUSP7|nr:diguanylate cyclase [Musicola paradisiaca]ACS84162.1 diguanylate cyclase with hemerythrin-like metal-binding domain [Musicola paradisiaca Ech703]
MHADVPTMFMMIIVCSSALAICMRWSAHGIKDRALIICTRALVCHATAYSLYALRGTIPDVISIVAANILIATTYSTLLLAITQFQQRHIRPVILWLPVIFTAGFFSIMLDNQYARTLASSLICLSQAILVVTYLMTQDQSLPTRGRNLMVLGLTINVMAFIVRIILLIYTGATPFSVLSSSTAQTVTYMTSFMTLLFIANGMIMMAKDRAEHLNNLMARQDSLTGCWNRIRIQEIARQEMERLERYGYPVSLLMFDLDHFKEVNDKFGHSVGDKVLKGFSDTALALLRTTDVFGRWGGEEFVAILPATGFTGAVQTAERIRAALEAQTFPGGVKITTSIGVSVCQSTDHWESWLGRADAALYRAKAAGRNRTETETLVSQGHDVSLPDSNLVRLIWNDAYNIGNQAIDQEHRQLFNRANQLLQVIVLNGSQTAFMVQLRELIDELSDHMQHEEQFLWDAHHPDADQHAKIHNHLLWRAEEMVQRYEQQQIGLIELFHYVVYEVITQHMLIEDRKLNLSSYNVEVHHALQE